MNKTQEHNTEKLQQTVNYIVERAESQFANSIKKISSQYINDFTVDIGKEIRSLASQIRAENFRHLKKDIFDIVNPESTSNIRLTASQIISELLKEVIGSKWQFK